MMEKVLVNITISNNLDDSPQSTTSTSSSATSLTVSITIFFYKQNMVGKDKEQIDKMVMVHCI